MMKQFNYLIILYFGFELIAHAVVPIFTTILSEAIDLATIDTLMGLIHQFYEFLIVLGLLAIFRPRDWPDYFNLNILDRFGNNDNAQNEEPPKLAPMA